MKTKLILLEVFSFLLIVLYLYSSVTKLLDFKAFTESINYQPFDNRYTPLITFVLPAAELLCALLLMFTRTRNFAFYFSTVLMTVFTGYVVLIQLNYYGHVPCACGGVISTFNWTQHLYFNIFFLLISIGGIILQRINLHTKHPQSFRFS